MANTSEVHIVLRMGDYATTRLTHGSSNITLRVLPNNTAHVVLSPATLVDMQRAAAANPGIGPYYTALRDTNTTDRAIASTDDFADTTTPLTVPERLGVHGTSLAQLTSYINRRSCSPRLPPNFLGTLIHYGISVIHLPYLSHSPPLTANLSEPAAAWRKNFVHSQLDQQILGERATYPDVQLDDFLESVNGSLSAVSGVAGAEHFSKGEMRQVLWDLEEDGVIDLFDDVIWRKRTEE